MIWRIFEKSKPINFILLGLYLSGYFAGFFWRSAYSSMRYGLPGTIWTLGLLIGGIFLAHNLSQKGNLTRNNSYAALFFVLFTCAFPQLFTAPNIILANSMALWALRKLLNPKNGLLSKPDIFDASLWICVAAVAYIGAIFYLLLVYIALIFYTNRHYKNWLIPLMAAAVVIICLYTYSVWFDMAVLWKRVALFHIREHPWQISSHNNDIAFLWLVLAGWAAIIAGLLGGRGKKRQRHPSLFIASVLWMIGLLLSLFAESEREVTAVFLILPTSVFVARRVERLRKGWMREVFIVLAILLPLLWMLSDFGSV